MNEHSKTNLQEAQEALELAVREGVIPPHRANSWSDEEVLTWYKSLFTVTPEKEEAF